MRSCLWCPTAKRCVFKSRLKRSDSTADRTTSSKPSGRRLRKYTNYNVLFRWARALIGRRGYTANMYVCGSRSLLWVFGSFYCLVRHVTLVRIYPSSYGSQKPFRWRCANFCSFLTYNNNYTLVVINEEFVQIAVESNGPINSGGRAIKMRDMKMRER